MTEAKKRLKVCEARAIESQARALDLYRGTQQIKAAADLRLQAARLYLEVDEDE